MSFKVFVCAGEASGDIHGAELLNPLRRIDPETEAFGVGGPRMAAEGFETIVPMSELGQAGLVEVLRDLPKLFDLFDRITEEVLRRRPDVAVLIDFPDFNLRLAGRLKSAGIRVAYYVSPQLWAWRRGRIRTIRRCVDRMLVLFPFEEPFYRDAGVPVTFVGHPIVDSLAPFRSTGAAAHADSPPTIAFLPGSRRSEVSALLPTMIQTIPEIRKNHPGARFLLALSPTLPASFYDAIVPIETDLERVVPEDRYRLLSTCHGALVASGTATLEMALLGVPMVVGYRLNPLSYLLARWLVKVPHVGLVNLVAEERIVPERIQGEFRAGILAADLAPLVVPGEPRDRTLAALQRAAGRLGPPGAGERAAHEVMALASGDPGKKAA